MKPPAPYYGSKTRAATVVWGALGRDVGNYVEPFCGMASCLLARPEPARRVVETINDVYAMIPNVWRAIREDPGGVAYWCDQPVFEADLHAVHRWLLEQATEDWVDRIRTDPEFFDAKIAGRWLWGKSAWLGSGWCRDVHIRRKPALGGQGTRSKTGVGVHSAGMRPPKSKPCLRGGGTQKPGLGHGQGVHAMDVRDGLREYFDRLSNRLRYVRATCGDWRRVLTPAVTVSHGTTGVLLDPPYAEDTGRKMGLYAKDEGAISEAVREWALEHGEDARYRIVLCGLEGEHEMPESWTCVQWVPRTNFRNRGRERLWLSPHCLVRREQLEFQLGEDP